MAADVSARVHLVAEKLQQKAQDAQQKGNKTAASALAASVSDLRQALALISEQRHLLARRHGESDDEDEDVEALATRLARVQTMLSKKSEDMRTRGNETASTALQQAAETVTQARTRVLEQQQTLFGLLERWKTIEIAVIDDKMKEESVLDRVQRLVELEHVVLEVWPEYQIVEVKNAILQWREMEEEMKRGIKREIERREEDAALLEQQREACRAMEQLVRESDQEIQDLSRKAAEEMQTLKLELEGLTLENERMKRVHTEEVDGLKLQLTSALEMIEKREEQERELKCQVEEVTEEKEELRRRCEAEMSELRHQLEELSGELTEEGKVRESIEQLKEEPLQMHVDEDTKRKREILKECDGEVVDCEKRVQKMEEEQDAMEDKLKLLEIELDTLREEKEKLVKVHADKVTTLEKTFQDEIEMLQSQIKSAAASCAMDETRLMNMEEVQALRVQLKDLNLRKECLEQVHADEVEQLRQRHLVEVENVRLELDRFTADDSLKTNLVGHELQQLQAEIGALTIEKDRLVKEHAATIEHLYHQLKDVKAERILKGQGESGDEEGVGEIMDVPVLELVEDESQHSALCAEDEVEVSCTSQDDAGSKSTAFDELHAQIARYEEQVQAQQAQISQMKAEYQQSIDHLTNVKVAAVDELQRTHEEETLRIQTSLDTLQAQVTAYEVRCQDEQCATRLLETERVQLEQQIELLTNENAQARTLQSTHGEETTRLTQRIVDNERTIDALSTQLEELEKVLATRSAEQKETAASLERCEAALSACRSDLAVQVHECTQLKSEQQTVQKIDEEADKYLVQLQMELRDVVIVVNGKGGDVDAVNGLNSRVWQCQEVAEVGCALASVVSDLVAVRDQLRATEAQLNEFRRDSDKQKRVLEEFVKSLDRHLLARDREEEEQMDTKLDELLTAAKTKSLRWLDELQQLRDRIEFDAIKIQELEREKLQVQDRVEKTKASSRELEERNEALNKQVAALNREKEDLKKAGEKLEALHLSASNLEQQQLEEVANLQQQLARVQSEFERYRVRSHTALKKMEKRAELLNGMRKENEALKSQVKESHEQREEADVARRDSETRLNEVQRTLEMMQVEFHQFAVEKARVIAELKEGSKHLVAERDQLKAKVDELTLSLEEFLIQKRQTEDENERVKEAERAAFLERLSSATAAIHAAKEDSQKAHDALEASKVECSEQQRQIEALKQQIKARCTASIGDENWVRSVASTGVPLASSKDSKIIAGLENELVDLRASETALKQQLDDARAELVGLQERFATNKAATAEKVFALEEQCRKCDLKVATATEEVCRLRAELGNATRIAQRSEASLMLAEEERIDGRGLELWQLRSELQDASTEIALLTKALDTCRDELQEARNSVSANTLSTTSIPVVPTSAMLSAKDDAVKKLRKQVLELQEELQTLREEKTELELKVEQAELHELQATRKHLQSDKERVLQAQRRQTRVLVLKQQITTIIAELHTRLEEHSLAFRNVCDFRDDRHAFVAAEQPCKADAEFEECLVMRSGVVIKAGASFELPVICEKSGWRVVWSFSVKEEAADVLFKLMAKVLDATSTEVEIVPSERMNDMSGVFHVQHDRTTLVFEWNNAFSWLNEKTLDYHVSIQEPLTVVEQQTRRTEREVEARVKQLMDGLALMHAEAARRSELAATLQRLEECKAMKEAQLQELKTYRAQVMEQKMRLQEEMETLKALFAVLLEEQDKVEDVEESLTRIWEEATAEREDVEITLQLAGNGAQMESLAQEVEAEIKNVREQLNSVDEDSPIVKELT